MTCQVNTSLKCFLRNGGGNTRDGESDEFNEHMYTRILHIHTHTQDNHSNRFRTSAKSTAMS